MTSIPEQVRPRVRKAKFRNSSRRSSKEPWNRWIWKQHRIGTGRKSSHPLPASNLEQEIWPLGSTVLVGNTSAQRNWVLKEFLVELGAITRAEAESRLANQPTGAFLARLTERLWGYALSVRNPAGSVSHFLVDAGQRRRHKKYTLLGSTDPPQKSLRKSILLHQSGESWWFRPEPKENLSDASHR